MFLRSLLLRATSTVGWISKTKTNLILLTFIDGKQRWHIMDFVIYPRSLGSVHNYENQRCYKNNRYITVFTQNDEEATAQNEQIICFSSINELQEGNTNCDFGGLFLNVEPSDLLRFLSSHMRSIIIIIIVIIIIIAFQGTNRDFPNLLTAHRTVSNTYAQVARAQLCANHVQHIQRSSRATRYVPRDTMGQLSYSVWQSWNRICFSFILLAEPLTDERGQETGSTRRKPLATSSRKCHTI